MDNFSMSPEEKKASVSPKPYIHQQRLLKYESLNPDMSQPSSNASNVSANSLDGSLNGIERTPPIGSRNQRSIFTNKELRSSFAH